MARPARVVSALAVAFSSKYTRLATACGSPTPLAGPRAIWPYQGGLFIGLHDGSRVVYVDAIGVAHTFLDGDKHAHGGDDEPSDSPVPKVSEVRSVATTATGDLIVVENDLGFVRMVRAAGR